MRTVSPCFILLVSLAWLGMLAVQAQPQWRFHLAFEDGSGARDTLWFIYDTTATEGWDTNPQVDDHLGEGAVEMDLEVFNVWTWNWQYDSTKTKAFPYSVFPMAQMQVMAFNYVAPVTIRWDRNLFNAPELPTEPFIGHAILGSEYFFWTGMEDPLAGGFNMLTADSVVIEEPDWLFFQCTLIFGESSGLGVGEVDAAPLHLYPNPANDQVRWSAPGRLARMEILDARGRTVLVTGPVSSGTWINIGHLPAGSYTVRAFTSNAVHHARFIKMAP